jgi:hypothetical protein
VAEHFGALHQVEVGHGQPSSQETKQLGTLILEEEKCHIAGVDAVTNHLPFMGKKPVKLVPGNGIAIARAGIAEDHVERKDTGGNPEGNELLDIPMDVVINPVVIRGGPAGAIQVENARIQRVGGWLSEDAKVGRWRLEL